MSLAQRIILWMGIGLPTSGIALAQSDIELSESDRIQAKTLYDDGRRQFESGFYDRAIRAWEEAYVISQKAEILHNIAVAHEKLGQLEQSIHYLERYRSYAPLDEQIILDRRILVLERLQQERALQNQRLNEVTLATPPSRPSIQWSTVSLFGTGFAATTAGVVLGVNARNARNAAQEYCRDWDAETICSTAAQESLLRQKRFALGADLSFGMAAIATATGVVLVMKKTPLASSLHLRIQPQSIHMEGRF